jgi:ribulose-5-phosphate 4-epimerase/fuculose-1-phosphate aldolase
MDLPLAEDLKQARARLARQDLFEVAYGLLSVRIPASGDALFLAFDAPQAQPESVGESRQSCEARALHAQIYRARADVGSIATAGGKFTRALADQDENLAPVFDEQVRHLGPFAHFARVGSPDSLRLALAGHGNVLAGKGTAIVLGVNCRRMVFNVELLEKCAKAFLLARATGSPTSTIPWWVRRIAHGRLVREEKRAAARFAAGLLPEDAKAY